MTVVAETKPNDIPDDVWGETGMEFDKLYDAEPDLDGGCELGISGDGRQNGPHRA